LRHERIVDLARVHLPMTILSKHRFFHDLAFDQGDNCSGGVEMVRLFC
jgi:hypothetical protein